MLLTSAPSEDFRPFLFVVSFLHEKVRGELAEFGPQSFMRPERQLSISIRFSFRGHV